jgi:O-antigen/teichoic acid export membrane protein
MLSEPDADQEKILGNLVTLRLITAVVVFAASIGVAMFLPWGTMAHAAIAIGAFSFIFLSLHQIFVGLFQKNLRMTYPAVAEVVGRAVLLIGIGVAAALHGNLLMIMAGLGAANLAMLAISFKYARRLQPFSLRLDRNIIIKIFRRSWPIALSIMFNLVYLRGDVMIMKIVGRSEAEIGWYGAAYKPLDVITVIPIIFMGLVLPLFVQAWSRADHEKIERIIQRAIDAVSILAFPTLVGGVILATPLMLFISGPQFAASGPLLALLVVAAFMVFYGALFGHLIVGIGKQKIMTWVYATDAAVSLSLYFLLIPRYGARGAAFVTIFSEAVIAVAATAIVLSITKIKPRLAVLGKAVAAAVVMGGVLYGLPTLHVIIRVITGAIVYGLLMLAFKAVPKEELKKIIARA